jgi:membrane fusion protein (multidrug efflux system)
MSPHFNPRFNRSRITSAAVTLLAGLLLASGCGKANKAAGPAAAPPALEVHVLTIKSQPVALAQELPGRTSSFRVAEVRARISGIVLHRLFTEGTNVKAGDVLFEIDPAPYQAALDSAKANLAKAQASLVSAKAQAGRYHDLVGTEAISKQTYDDAVANQLALAAGVAAAQAAVQTADINLGYTRVTAPISGRIGRAAVTEGAYVQQGTATLLATIQQLDPLYVDLTQSAEDVLRLKQALASGRLQRDAGGSAKLTVILGNNQPYAETGSLEFSDVSVDPTTGMVTLRGTIPNPHLDLLPGMFVRAKIEEGTNPAAILVPQAVVSRDPLGQAIVLVVGRNDKVEQRILQVPRTVGTDWLVTSGLKPGDRVILDNRQKIRPGSPVKPVEADDSAASSPSTAG